MATSREAADAVGVLVGQLAGWPATIYADAKTGACAVSVYSTRRSDFAAAKLDQVRAGLERIRSCGLDIRPGRISVRRLRREDWAESWKKHFRPIEIGNALLLKPGWSRKRPRPGQAVVVLDPGLSFGTGQHPTTDFCLRQLVRLRKSGCRQSFLDIGTGSGILAIAAAKLGYGPVVAIDFDADAVRSARANARRNGVGRKIRILHQDLTRLPLRGAGRYDVVCANLIATLLIAERERIVNRVAPGGTVVLAGVLRSEFEAVRRAYERAGMRLVASRAQNEWRSGAFARAETEQIGKVGK